MKNRMQNKKIWITGASSGIGEACAYKFAQEGTALIITALEDDLLEKVADKCRQLGAKAVKILPFDLSRTEEVAALAETAWQQFNGLDVVYNNAGISQRADTVETQMSVFRKIMDVNFMSPIIIAKTLLPKMLANGGGQFAVTTSIAGKFGFPLRSAYCSSKHALYGFFETVQAEYFAQNIRVTFICPGRVKTNISLYALEKDGTPHGQLDAGQAGGITPQQAANRICKAIKRQKREVLVGGKELLLVYLKRFLPSVVAWIARRIKAM
jgi:short-subunit dehydrogenase